ncbi:uncharacterized protein ATNIH1004_007029 [Aspergillus tanneri]|uniref:Uncharacterized protein n=1 Tax=Aspergillus tanneri TaxID=1220188 RepID=A0A5M9MJV1_9EURO|nr:uncharacterized protein ATNIH1004_007029 [Aspergillus tanneri]KAA8645610.1 hypothetical protein ATNIH1004_007029 [Aspergillus tanneri]
MERITHAHGIQYDGAMHLTYGDGLASPSGASAAVHRVSDTVGILLNATLYRLSVYLQPRAALSVHARFNAEAETGQIYAASILHLATHACDAVFCRPSGRVQQPKFGLSLLAGHLIADATLVTVRRSTAVSAFLMKIAYRRNRPEHQDCTPTGN